MYAEQIQTETVSCCPWGNVTVLVGFRVRRLGYYDHTQRQLGERALYVFPAQGDAKRITCDGPEGAPVLPEDPVVRKVRIIFIHICQSID